MKPARPLTGNAEGVVWPPVFAQHGHLAALVLTLRETEWLDPAPLAVNQGRQLAVLVAHFARCSPWFAQRLAKASLTEIDHPDSLATLPVLTRAEAQELLPLADAVLPPSHLPTVKVQSSGSSGVPVVAYKTQLTQLMWLALTLRYHDWAEPGGYGRLVTIRPNLDGALEHDDWGPPVTLFHATGAMRRIRSDLSLEDQAAIIAAFRPDTLIAYPSLIAALLAMPDGLAALAGVSGFRTMGETVSTDFRREVLNVTGQRVFDCYSSEEVGYIAVQCPEADCYHVMAESVIVEILRDDGSACEPGETGRVVVTDLMNFAMPFIRYDTGDYAVKGEVCRCGRGLPVIDRIVGRWRGMIIMPDGSRHWPRTGFHSYREIAAVRQYQMIQHAPDRIELRLSTPDPLTDGQYAALQALLRTTIGDGIGFEIVRFAGRLPPGPRDKTDEFISLIARPEAPRG